MIPFWQAVLLERAVLAINDPVGELEAVSPMHPAQAEYHFWLNGGRRMQTYASQARVEQCSLTEYVVNRDYLEEDNAVL